MRYCYYVYNEDLQTFDCFESTSLEQALMDCSFTDKAFIYDRKTQLLLFTPFQNLTF